MIYVRVIAKFLFQMLLRICTHFAILSKLKRIFEFIKIVPVPVFRNPKVTGKRVT